MTMEMMKKQLKALCKNISFYEYANKNELRVLYCDYKGFLSSDDLNGLSVSIGIKKGNTELEEELNASLAKLSAEERSSLMAGAATRSSESAL